MFTRLGAGVCRRPVWRQPSVATAARSITAGAIQPTRMLAMCGTPTTSPFTMTRYGEVCMQRHTTRVVSKATQWRATSRTLVATSGGVSGGESARAATGSKNSKDKTEETAEERLERLKKNPHYHKYEKKLASVDLSNPDVLKGKELPPPDMDPAVAQLFMPKGIKPATGRLAADRDPSIKPLSAIMRLDKLGDATGDEIGELWKAYHLEQKGLGAVIAADVYAKMRQRTKECPMFILPVPRSEGIEFFLSQWRGHQAAFTSLLEYKTHGENARPYLLLNHYTELQDDKGIVLMAGDLDENVTLLDAQFLANQLQLYYLGDDAAYELVRKFNLNPGAFDHNEVLARLEQMATAGVSSSGEK